MRAPLLLLMVAASLAANPLSRFNSDLSACDLEEPRWHLVQRCGADCSAPTLESLDLRALCTERSGDRARKLQEVRLRACCERTAASALDAASRQEVAGGGSRCERRLRDLVQLGDMVATVDCSFDQILQRYDCKQGYSVRHTCLHCQAIYRRWVCSTLIPMYMTDTELNTTASNTNNNSSVTTAALVRTGQLDRRWAGGSVIGRWIRAAAVGPGRPTLHRIKPCLAVCQAVEQQCPYFLPGDRAPAFPTQYAGEPTFLCLDSQIPETGEQAANSNYGPDECCYKYCDSGVCAQCTPHLRGYNESSGRAREEIVCPVYEERQSMCSYASITDRPPTLIKFTIIIILCRTFSTVIYKMCSDVASL